MPKDIAIITGVSRLKGIGFAIAMELAKQGIEIFFTHWTSYDKSTPWGSQPNEIDQIAKKLTATGCKCEHLSVDLSQPDQIDKLMTAVTSKLGTQTILINNATHSTSSSIHSIDDKTLDQHYSVNLKGTTLLTAAFVNHFKGNSGRIINLTSGQSLGPMPSEIAYAMTKAAIETLTQTIATELAEKHITINAVNPGPNDTGWITFRYSQSCCFFN